LNLNESWDDRFLSLASVVATWSKDPSTKVGAVIVDPFRRIISTGYNGFPAKIADDSRYDIREEKLEMIIHGEINAILFAKRDLTDCTLYTVPFMPCSRCAAIIIQTGIKRVVAPSHTGIEQHTRWEKSFERSLALFGEAGVRVDLLTVC